MSQNNKDKDFAPINVELSDRISMTTKRPSPAKPTAPSASKSNNSLVTLLLVFSLTATAGCGYLFWLHKEQVSITNANEKRILSLENKLSTTGEEIGNSTVALQVKVNELSNRSQELWEQMDKLWASAWRRNQQEIKSLESNLGGFQKDVNKLLKDTESKVAIGLDKVQQVQKRLDGVNGKVGAQGNDILAINVEKESLQNTINKQSSELRQMAEKLILLEKRNTSLLQKLQQLEAKMVEIVNRSV